MDFLKKAFSDGDAPSSKRIMAFICLAAGITFAALRYPAEIVWTCFGAAAGLQGLTLVR